MAKKRKNKGIPSMIGGGLMLGVGSAAISKLGAPSGLSSAMVLPTKFVSLGVMAHMGKRTMDELHKIPKRRKRR